MEHLLREHQEKIMDCYFHSNVPSITPCADCGKAICATCRDDRGTCPSCRLAEKIDASSSMRQPLGGQVPPRAQQAHYQQAQQAQQQYAPPPQTQARATVAVAEPQDAVETRALVALGYPLWPLALIGLLDRKQSRYLKKQALQAIGFNVGFAAFGGLLALLVNIPILGFSAGVMLPFLIPVFLVAATFFGIKAWQGDEVHVPIISDWIEEKLPA
jgi:uncharacterized membrane protein